MKNWKAMIAIFSLLFFLAAESKSRELIDSIMYDGGKTINLYSDGTYEITVSTMEIIIVLRSASPPTGFGADPRDCRLSFDVVNQTTGRMLNFSSSIEVFDTNGSPLDVSGFASISPFSFGRGGAVNVGDRISDSVTISAGCDSVNEVIIESVSERSCNFEERP